MSRDSFDYVIVGSGSAGCVLANRLSADPANRVLLLEAGRPDHFWEPRVHMPAALGFPVGNKSFDWCYESEPEPFMNGRRMAHARGKVLGGCSSINAMVYQRGNPLDFDRWAADEGVGDWDYAHSLPYFKRIETSDLEPREPWRGYSGPQRIERGPVTNPLFTAFFDAARQAGHPMTGDMNGPVNEGFAPYERTIHNGRRMSAARAYVHPVRGRKNLEVRCNALATGVVFQGSRAVGVRYLPQGPVGARRGGECFVSAGEVVLAGGAINTPQLLQLSGVGDAAHLASLDVPLVHHLPGVGEDLQDHLAAHVQHGCTQPITMGILREKKNWPSIAAKWLLGHNGPGATNIFEAGGFIRSRPEMPIPDLMFGFAPVAMRFDPDMPVQIHGYQLHIGAMRLEARGHVKISSTDPTRHPSLLYNFLSTEADRQFWIDAVRIGRELLDQPAFAEFDAGETYPGRAEVDSDQQILDWVARGGQTGLHPTSTCRMGVDEMSVVDPSSMAVHGVSGLRVVDASVMPYCPNGATHAPTMMIAERASDLILGNTPLAPEYVDRGAPGADRAFASAATGPVPTVAPVR
ncbi:choline dehydrogenase [Pseudonocardia sediminis]|uniref:Choline dehydrogenase n=1 Tax=Pseudonocardia sediminis TaxID=1397368 RepID=A0A4Q7UW13_PSEST|nr:choline dehydrogenase [Pseudonocardia sediminis]RZT85051.1 choline dehydrogenase [Pseudonocardia sediminis]